MAGAIRNAKRRKERKSVNKAEAKAKIAETSRNLKPGAIQHLRTIQNTIRKGS